MCNVICDSVLHFKIVNVHKERKAVLLALKGTTDDSDTENDNSVDLLEGEEHKLCIPRRKQTDCNWKPFLMQRNTDKIIEHDGSAAQFDYAVLNWLQPTWIFIDAHLSGITSADVLWYS